MRWILFLPRRHPSVIYLDLVDCFSSIFPVMYAVGEVDFWIFWIFNFLQFAIDWKNNSKTKVERCFSFFRIFLCGNELLQIKND
jgi:hypothetical protein